MALNGWIDRDGWLIRAGDAREAANTAVFTEVLNLALSAARGDLGTPFRRSRHATTYRSSVGAGGVNGFEIFVKLIDPPSGFERIKAAFRQSNASHVVAVTKALTDAGFGVAAILAYGSERATGREVIVTRRTDGNGLIRTVTSDGNENAAYKRAVLTALGKEVARLHRSGFVHGDLTPYNIFVIRGEPPEFVFIDHERTSRIFPIGRRYRQLRNLVQLGRFDLPGLSRSDRMRVMRGYADVMVGVNRRERRQLVMKVMAMLDRRMSRDRALQFRNTRHVNQGG